MIKGCVRNNARENLKSIILTTIKPPKKSKLKRKTGNGLKMSPIQFHDKPESPPYRTVEMVASIADVDLDERIINLFTGDHL